MQKILISACLIGQNVRYHGGNALYESPILEIWHKEGRLIPLCPEMSAGLPAPRPSCEIIGGDGYTVLEKKAMVLSHTKLDRTKEFVLGAENALFTAKKHHISVAILKSNSPSCGNNMIYDGTYTGTLKEGIGVTAALLSKNGVKMFNEHQLQTALDFLIALEKNVS